MTADPDGLAELRRRVYGPDGTDEDRRRYRLALGAASAPSSAGPAVGTVEQPVAAPLGSGRPPRRRTVLLATGVGVVGAAAVGVAALLRPAAPSGPAPETLPVTAEEQDGFADALVSGTDAGIAAFLVTHRLPRELRDAVPSYVLEQRGTGPSTLALLPRGGTGDLTIEGRTTPTVVQAAGRVTVLLVVAGGADVGWALTAASRVVAERAGFQQSGALTSATVPYARGTRPDRLRVEVPSGTVWGVAAVYSD